MKTGRCGVEKDRKSSMGSENQTHSGARVYFVDKLTASVPVTLSVKYITDIHWSTHVSGTYQQGSTGRNTKAETATRNCNTHAGGAGPRAGQAPEPGPPRLQVYQNEWRPRRRRARQTPGRVRRAAEIIVRRAAAAVRPQPHRSAVTTAPRTDNTNNGWGRPAPACLLSAD